MRAESAGSFANRRGSSVNGVNEEWEQTKCAEMREVPPHCIGRCSLCVSHRHKHKHAHTPASFFFHIHPCYLTLFATFSAHIDTKHFLFAPLRTYMHILLLSHSPYHTPILTYAPIHTFLVCPPSICFFTSPHKVCSPLFSPSALPWGGDTL